jgi:glycerophosphoryl diester phosphodiesterase
MSIASVTPATLPSSGTTTLTITGAGFGEANSVALVSTVGRVVLNAPRRTFLERLATKKDGPFLIAHRGCQSLAPENTVASFICAARLGLDAIETDVRLTADGALVCVHDDTLKRMFGIDREVSSMSLEELRKLIPVKSKDKGKEKKGKIKVNGLESWPKEALRIPTFAEYLDVCERYDKVPFIETKGDVAVVKPVLEEVRRRGLAEVAVLSSIPFDHIREARRLDKEIFVHHIFSEPTLLDELAAMGNAGLSYNYKDLAEVPEGLVGRVHAKGVKMCLRAGDTPEAVAKMRELGLDYIPTNVTVPLD